MNYICVSSYFMEQYESLGSVEQELPHISLEAWERLFGGDRVQNAVNFIEVSDNELETIYVLGIPHKDNEDIIYIPGVQWAEDDEYNVSIRIVDKSEIPDATSITFKVFDESFYTIDYKDELATVLSSKKLLRLGDSVECFSYKLEVVQLEPSGLVFCDGEEVAILFEDDLKPLTAVEPVAVAAATAAAAAAVAAAEPVKGKNGKFIPFSGKGYSLK